MSEFEPMLRELLSAGHTARFRAAGDSMYPAIRGGDYLYIVPSVVSELRRGDVVLAATDRGLTAHRIVCIRGRDGSLRITTRGDNSLRNDRPVGAADILGRVARVDGATTVRKPGLESAPILRFAAVLVRRLRGALQQ